MLSDDIRNLLVERPLPHSAEAERAILGAIILDNELAHQAIELLKPSDFYVRAHQCIFHAMMSLCDVGQKISPVAISEQLKREQILEQIGGMTYLSKLTSGLPHIADVAASAREVKGHSMLRQIVKVANKMTSEALEGEDEPEIILDHAEQLISDLSGGSRVGAARNPEANIETIIRSIEFPPEYLRSGIIILSYFADVLRHKKLSEDIKVSIVQSGLKVSLIIDSPTGHREEIEKTLEQYGMVVLHKQPPESLTTDPYELAELKSQLRYAEVQIETQRELLAAKKADVESLRAEVKDTRDMVRGFMSLMEGLVSHSSALSAGLKELAQQAAHGQNKALESALDNLSKLIDRGVREEDHDEVIQNLTTIRQQDPGVFQRVYDTLIMGAVSGAAGNYLYAWLQAFIYGLPK